MTPREKALDARELIRKAYQSSIDTLIGILNDCGGFIDTRACEERPILYAMVDTNYGNATIENSSVAIHGIRLYDDVIYIITDTELDNYQYDNGCEFEYYYNFDGKDAELLDDAMKDLTYFRDLDDGYTDVKATIFNIISGLSSYLD